MNDDHGLKRLPLSGKTIVVTRAKEQAIEFAGILESLGARVIRFPAVEFTAPDDWSQCDDVLSSLNTYSGVVVTSVNAVHSLFRRAARQSVVPQLQGLRVYTVGEATRRAAEQHGAIVATLGDPHSGEALAQEIVRMVPAGARLIFPKGNLGGAELISIVSAAGIRLDAVDVYQTVEPPFDAERRAMVGLIESTADLLTFFSPSSVINVVHHLSDESRTRIPAAVIGDTTSAAAHRAGFRVVLMAPRSAAAPFAAAIRQFYSQNTESGKIREQ